MHLAVIAIILGQAAILGRASLLVYAAILWVTVASFARFYEEPTLSDKYGERTPPTAARSGPGCRGRRRGRVTTGSSDCHGRATSSGIAPRRVDPKARSMAP